MLPVTSFTGRNLQGHMRWQIDKMCILHARCDLRFIHGYLQVLQQQMAELETKLGQARSDSKAQVKGHNSGKKELEVSCILMQPCISKLAEKL